MCPSGIFVWWFLPPFMLFSMFHTALSNTDPVMGCLAMRISEERCPIAYRIKPWVPHCICISLQTLNSFPKLEDKTTYPTLSLHVFFPLLFSLFICSHPIYLSGPLHRRKVPAPWLPAFLQGLPNYLGIFLWQKCVIFIVILFHLFLSLL